MSSTIPAAVIQRRRGPLWLVAGVIVVGFGLSGAIYWYARVAIAARVETEFARRVEIRNALTREVIGNYVAGVFALKSLFNGSVAVTREEFRDVAVDIRKRYAGITALEWVPVIAADQRAAFERQVSEGTGRDFKFVQYTAAGEVTAAHNRPEYYPIVYLEPLEGNERAWGYDIKTAPSEIFIERARRSGEMVVSWKFPLVQSRSGIVMVWPIYAKVAGKRVSRVGGFVQGVFRVDELLAQSELRTPASTTEMLYLDDSAESPDQRLLYDPRHLVQSPDRLAAVEAEFRKQLHREYSIELGGRRWVALYRASPRWIAEQQTILPELWLLAGLTATSLLAGLISALARRTASIQHEVNERTKELNESRRQLSSLLHTLPGTAVRCVQDSELAVVFVSEGARALTGYEADELLAKPTLLRDMVHPADLEMVRMTTRLSLQSRNDFEMEFRILPREGKEKWVLARGRGAAGSDGRPLLEGLAIDITDYKAAEAENLAMERALLESQKLESIGLLAGGIAHDFNNLLAGIVGHANLARLKLADDSPALDHLRKIEAGTSRAAELCQQMLAYSGRGQRIIEPVDVSRVVQETIPLVHGSLASQVQMQLQLSDRPAVTMADATQIRQIAMNLIINAADAVGAESGHIVISTGARWVEAEQLALAKVSENVRPGHYVFLKVSDTGCGMSPETMARMFDPFFTTKFTGRGLGLAAVLGIVRAHSGALHVESALGTGTTFTLWLPATDVPPSPNSSMPSATPWRRRGNVLIIDDEEPVREIAAELVRSFGLSVVIADGGIDGLEKFRADPKGFDLVILDLTMPGMNGEETLAALRGINPQVRVVLASGYSNEERLAELARGGSLVFLQKPFTRGQLERKLREFLA